MELLDFTSALYLGLRHSSSTLPAWSQLTTGTPAVIREPRVARVVAADVATLVGATRGVVATSTLHLALDLLPLVAPRGATLYADASLYSIAQRGVERARARGAFVRVFRAHDPRALRARLECDAPFVRPPVVVTDGLCPSCGRVAPLRAYAAHVRAFGGRLVVDDTQALGVLGYGPEADHPYGHGGGGALRHLGIAGADVITIASLAKGFGAPMAVLAGSGAMVRLFQRESDTRVHNSPPSIVALLAARRALHVNARHGDALRDRLARRVARLRARLAPTELLRTRWLFPVQPLRVPAGIDAVALHRELTRRGVRTALTRGHDDIAALTFVVTAAHEPSAIDRAAAETIDVLHRAGAFRVARRMARAG